MTHGTSVVQLREQTYLANFFVIMSSTSIDNHLIDGVQTLLKSLMPLEVNQEKPLIA